MASHTITLGNVYIMGQYVNVKCTLAACVLHYATKQRCKHRDTINKIEIRLKTRYHGIPVSKFVVEHIIDGASVCDVASRVTETIITKLTIYAIPSIVELFGAGTCCLVKNPISWLRAHDAAVRSFMFMQVKCLSS